MNTYIFIPAYLLCYVLQILFLIKEKKQQLVQTLYFKGAASLVFVLLAALSFVFGGKTQSFFAVFIFTGMCFDALADVVFNLRFAFKKIEKLSFLGGTFLFFTGHVFYLIAMIPQVEQLWIYFVIGLIIALLSQFYIWLVLKEVCLAYKIYGTIYIFSVSSMTAMATGNFIANYTSTGALFFAIGAVFFLISDLLLILNTFRKEKIYPMRVISFVTYYTGQLLIATSLFLL
ncbi:MAG: lysoplasmalogenase [Treponema sp.]|nr:lysoplasmalogenase [Treponema sp.]